MPAIDFRFNYSMQHWQSPSDAVVKCKWNKLHFIAHKKLIASAVCIVYFVLAKWQALIKSENRCMYESRNTSRHSVYGLNRDDQEPHRTDKWTYLTLTCPVSLKITICRLYLIRPHTNPHQAKLYWTVSVYIAKRSCNLQEVIKV